MSIPNEPIEGRGPRDSDAGLERRAVLARLENFTFFESGSRWLLDRGLARMRRSRRAMAAAAVAWLPLALLVGIGRSQHAHVMREFARDYVVHVRALVAVPLLLLTATLIERRTRATVLRFVENDLVRDADLRPYVRIVERIERLRDGRAVQPLIIAIAIAVSTLSVVYANGRPDLDWATVTIAGHRRVTSAGWYYVLVTLPLFFTLILRWLWRWALWCEYLRLVARLRLHLLATHSDHATGISFISIASGGFGFALIPVNFVLSIAWVEKIVNHGITIDKLWGPVLAQVITVVVVVIAPTALFVEPIRAARRDAEHRYGALVQRYFDRFDRMWVQPASPRDDASLTELDAGDMADMTTLYEVIDKVRIVPLASQMLRELVLCVALPLAPVALAATSPKQIAQQIFHALV